MHPTQHRHTKIVLLFAVTATAVLGQNNFGYMRTASSDGTQLDTANTFYPRGTVAVSRNGVGNYNVSFTAAGGHAGGVVFVTALGPDAEYCKAGEFTGNATVISQQVLCFNAAGTAADTRYAAQVLYPNNERQIAYAWYDGGNINAPYSWSPGGAITATKQGTGLYIVTFPGINSPDHVQVNAYGTNNTHCFVTNWGPVSNVRVQCVNGANTPVDSAFNVAYVRGTNQPGLGFMNGFGRDANAGSFTPQSLYSYNSVGRPVTVTRTGTGLYSVRFAEINSAPAPSGAGPSAMAVGYAGSGQTTALRCSVDTITSEGTDLLVNVFCFNAAGAAANGLFNVLLFAPPQALPNGANNCANENATCNVPAGRTGRIWYGANGSFLLKSNVNSSQACTNANFGGDPALGVPKACFLLLDPLAPATTFYATGRFPDGSVLSGTVSIITTTGTVTASNLVVTGPSAQTFSNLIGFGPQQGATVWITRNAAGTLDLNLGVAAASLAGYTGGSIFGNFFNLATNTAGAQLVSGALLTAPCTYSLNPTSATIGAGAGSTSTQVTVNNAACAWLTSSNAAFLTVTSAASATGNGTVTIAASANPSQTQRQGTVTIGGQTFTVNQNGDAGAGCAYVLSQASANVTSAGGSVTVNVTASPGTCQWLVSNPSSFITTNTQGGTGSGGVTLTVQPNPSAQSRSSVLTIAGQAFTVLQSGAGTTPTTSGPMRFVPLEPCRILETRPEYNVFPTRTGVFGPPFLNTNETRTLSLPASTCAVPASARAYVLTVTVIPRAQGVDYVTVYPTGEARPDFFTVRSPDGLTVANSAIVRAGTNNSIDIFTTTNTDMVIDISGYFTDNPQQSNLVFYPLTPCRVVDTRILYRQPAGPFGPPTMNAQESRSYRFPVSPCPVPNGAAAYSVTITVEPNGLPLPFLTAWPTGTARPAVSSMNSPAGRVLANSVIVPASPNGSIDIFTFGATDFIVDINGYFAPDDGVNGLFFYAVGQCRAADTSNGTYTGSFGPPLIESETVRTMAIPAAPRCSGIPNNARAFAVNTTIVPNGSSVPFLTLYPTGQPRPNASVINAFQGQTVSSAAIIPAGPNGSIDIFAFRRTHTIVEISGFFGRQP